MNKTNSETSPADSQKEMNRLREELSWYKATYENRSIPGVMATITSNKIRNKKKAFFNALLRKKKIKEKYVLSGVLEYVRDKKSKSVFKSLTGLISQYHFRLFFNLRSILLYKLTSRYKRMHNLLYQVPQTANSISRDQIIKDIDAFNYKPLISFIMPVYNTRPDLLEIAVKSIEAQYYDHWELIAVDDCSSNKATIDLLKILSSRRKIKTVFLKQNSGISESSNEALKRVSGEFIALMDHDDEVTPDALYWIVKAINDHPRADILYTDECKVDERGNLSDFFLKPDWSPELLFNMMYVGHLTVYRSSFLFTKVGYFRKEYDFSQDYDLILRATEKTTEIVHIQKVLYHWRLTDGSASQGDKPYARKTNLAALEDAMKRRNVKASVIELPTANRVKLALPENPMVSLIIPTDSYENLIVSVKSIHNNTSFNNYEIVAVTNSSLIRRLNNETKYDKLKLVAYDKPYNFSDKCNWGASHCSGDVLIFYNDDVRPITKDWIENTIEYLYIDGVGGVSPKLVYEDDSVQYAGMATGVRNLTGTTFHTYHMDSNAYLNFVQSVRNVTILSGACLAIKKTLFFEVGGFDAINTPSAHSDVDLSFKIIQKGYRCVYTPHATMRHIGHLSLSVHEKKEIKFKKDLADIYLLKKWGSYIGNDPYFTEPMRNMLYHDSPEYYKVVGSGVDRTTSQSKGNVLLISHDLSLSGAPLVLVDIAKVLLNSGYFPVVCSPSDGPLRETYEELGVTVIIDVLVLRQHPSFERFARNFDLLICNTIVTWPVVLQMQATVKTVWWIQEAKVIDLFANNAEMVQALRTAKNIITVSDYSIEHIRKYTGTPVKKIYNSCSDIDGIPFSKVLEGEKIVISLIGSIESRKGQDIILEALNNISTGLLSKIELRLIGRILDYEYYKSLQPKAADKPWVKFLGEMDHNECLKQLETTHILVNASRDDPFPVTLVEAFCYGKACIVSNRSGFAEVITEGVNGYVFNIDDVADLSGKIALTVSSGTRIEQMGIAARKTFEKFLRPETFSDRLLHYIENEI
ncbi:MAG: glycosyltransferase [Sphingobacteriales bacterium]|nr:MAG: glycosyltransferase [Sphingobacteriales bacterium]